MENNILEMYMRQVSIDENNGMNETSGIDHETAKAVNEMRSSELDMANVYRMSYPNVDMGAFKSEISPIKVGVKRIYCPKCGKEVITTFPERKDPITGDIIQRFECDCGYKCNLDGKYPRLVYLDGDNNELKL